MEVTLIDNMGTDASVVNAARVSFKKLAENYTHRQNEQLIHYLAKHGHKSPFNHTYITMHIKAPIFVARQLVKHKFMPWNEVSRRYVDDPPEFYYPKDYRWRKRAVNKKQGSSDELTGVIFPSPFGDDEPTIDEFCVTFYNDLLELNVAPEQARMILPQNTYTEWYWSGTLGAWMDMVNLRTKEDTQSETRYVANCCRDILSDLYPISVDALSED